MADTPLRDDQSFRTRDDSALNGDGDLRARDERHAMRTDDAFGSDATMDDYSTTDAERTDDPVLNDTDLTDENLFEYPAGTENMDTRSANRFVAETEGGTLPEATGPAFDNATTGKPSEAGFGTVRVGRDRTTGTERDPLATHTVPLSDPTPDAL